MALQRHILEHEREELAAAESMKPSVDTEGVSEGEEALQGGRKRVVGQTRSTLLKCKARQVGYFILYKKFPICQDFFENYLVCC